MRAGRRVAPLVAGAVCLCAQPRGARASGDDFFAETPPEPAPGGSPQAPTPQTRAPSPSRLGGRGQLVVEGGSIVGVSSTTYSGNAASNLDLTLAPSVDYFLLRNVSIGLDLDLEYTSGRSYAPTGSVVQTTKTTVSGGPRVGVDVPLGGMASLWPRLTLAVESIHLRESLVPNGSARQAGRGAAAALTLAGPSVDLYVPVVFEVLPHLFLGAGPSVFHEFAPAKGGPLAGGQRTFVGTGMEIGGYFGGEPCSALPTTGEPVIQRRFGQARQLVLTNEEALGGGYTSYAGTGASVASLSFTLGVDYFVADHVSLGVVLGGGYSKETSAGARGAAVTSAGESYSAGLRLGVDVPLGSSVSIYPRATLGFAPSRDAQTTRGGESDSSSTDAFVSISVPLILQLARHFFVGLGPNLSHDLSRPLVSPSGATVQIDGTTIGATMLVGGWL